MDVQFEVSKEKGFTIEIGYFDTVQEIKQKILKYHKIPVARQTLYFNGQAMANERHTEYYEILHGSRTQLVVNPDPKKPKPIPKAIVKVGEPLPTPVPAPSIEKLELLVKIANNKHVSVEIDPSSTIRRLKEKIQELEPHIELSWCVISFRGNELFDQRSLGDYTIPNYFEVTATIRPFPTSSTSMSSSAPNSNSKKIKLMVFPKSGGQKIQVEVSPSDNVGDLRKELQRLQQQINFQLPSEGYLFIYKQNVMEDDHFFRWHDVKPNDTIEIFSGSVTGGSRNILGSN